MALRNSTDHYGSIAKWLHWTTALLFLGSYLSVYYRDWFTDKQTPENWTALQLHLSIGITILVLATLRILWRLGNPVPRLEPGSRLEHRAARLGHYALYAVMFILPITGYLGTGVGTEYFFLIDLPKFEDTAIFASLISESWGLSFKAFEKPIDFIHKTIMGEWLVWMLIVGHASAALYHHFWKRDATLLNMTIGKKP